MKFSDAILLLAPKSSSTLAHTTTSIEIVLFRSTLAPRSFLRSFSHQLLPVLSARIPGFRALLGQVLHRTNERSCFIERH